MTKLSFDLSRRVFSGALAACAMPAVAQPAPTTVSIAYPVPNIPWAAFQLGEDKGIFAKHGLKLQLRGLGTGPAVNTALISGSVDYGLGSSISHLSAIEKGVPFTSILVVARRMSYSLLASPKFAEEKKISKQSSLDEIVKALAGSRAAFTSPQDKATNEELLESHGVAKSSVRFVSVSGLPAALTALRQGDIDWFLNAPPAVYQAEETGAAIALLAPTQVPQWDMPIQITLLANRERLKGREDLTRRTVLAMNESVQYAVAHVEEVLVPARAMFPGVGDDILRKSFLAVGWRPDGVQTEADWNATADYVSKLGLIETKSRPQQGRDWTNEFLQGAAAK